MGSIKGDTRSLDYIPYTLGRASSCQGSGGDFLGGGMAGGGETKTISVSCYWG